MVNEVVVSKGAYSVTIYSREVADNYTNKLFLITIPQSSANQSTGQADNKIVDLLRITHQIVINGVVLNNTDKDSLIAISRGGGIDGGEVSLTYDGDTFNGYIEKITLTEKSSDEPASPPDDYYKYDVAITFVEGTRV